MLIAELSNPVFLPLGGAIYGQLFGVLFVAVLARRRGTVVPGSFRRRLALYAESVSGATALGFLIGLAAALIYLGSGRAISNLAVALVVAPSVCTVAWLVARRSGVDDLEKNAGSTL
jgi:hypothetical protein